MKRPTSPYLSDSGRIIASQTIFTKQIFQNIPKNIPKRSKNRPKRAKNAVYVKKTTDFWSKIFADKGAPFAFLLSVNFFCDMFFAACIKYKDSVLCRQPDKNVTFATIVHKYPERVEVERDLHHKV